MQFLAILTNCLTRKQSATLRRKAVKLDKAVTKHTEEAWMNFVNMDEANDQGVNNGYPHIWLCCTDNVVANWGREKKTELISFVVAEMGRLEM
jgi:hypothetical protein